MADEPKERKCPTCKADVQPVNIVDVDDGAVTFDCGACGARLIDNSERTALSKLE